MSEPSGCCNPCQTPELVEIPGIQGDPGIDGTDGTNGTNAYTITTADFTTPVSGSNVSILVADNSWMVVGQKLFIQNAGYYEVVSKSGSTGVTVKNKGYTDNAGSGVNVVAGAGVSPGGTQPSLAGKANSGANTDITSLGGLTTPLSVGQGGTGRATPVAPVTVYVTGVNQDVTTGFVTIAGAVLTLPVATTWILQAFVRVDGNTTTYATEKFLTAKLVRTNNTPGDIPSASATRVMGTMTNTIATIASMNVPAVVYTTANTNDALALQFTVEANNSGGNKARAIDAWIVATPVPLY